MKKILLIIVALFVFTVPAYSQGQVEVTVKAEIKQALTDAFLARFPDAGVRNAIINKIAKGGGYLEQIPDPDNPSQTIPNPVTKTDFIVNRIWLFMRQEYQAGSVRVKAEATDLSPDTELSGDGN